MQAKLEDLEDTMTALDWKVMDYNKKLDQCKNTIYLTSHQPLKQKLSLRYEKLENKRDKEYEKYLKCKATIIEFNRCIDDLGIQIDSLSEVVELSDD